MTPRLEVEAGINGCLLITDGHNSDLTSLTKHALSFLEQQAGTNLSRTLIISDINGDDLATEMYYAEIKRVIDTSNVNQIVFVGPELSSNRSVFNFKNSIFFESTNDFLNSDFVQQVHDEVLLLKVAPNFEPERIQHYLQLYPHDTVMEIDFDAMFHNIDHFRSKLHPQTMMMCMVKASAYGCGSIEVALAMQHYGINYLAVAFTHEGADLRKAGIKLPILVLDPQPAALHHLFINNLEPEVGSFDFLKAVIKEARLHKLSSYPIHIKLDTGMHRAGFDSADLDKLCDILKKSPEVKVKSIFSHLAAADEAADEMRHFTIEQLQLFKTNSDYIVSQLEYKIIRHILNTAGIELYSEYQFDMVRLGIGLWGVNCSNEEMLRNVCSLSTHVMQVKTVKAGETVGYGRRGKVDKDKKIALLPLGYADGIDRRLGNGVGSVFIDGARVPIIGNICMDLMMIDVTGLNVKTGDRVVVFNDKQGIAEIAAILGTIPYEVLTSISSRVRRVYYRK